MLSIALKKLQECIKKNNLNFSSIREEVLKEIVLSDQALCSEEISYRVNKKIHKKVSYNTIYRVLKLFEDCNIVATIQSDDKKTHYCLITPKCNAYTLDCDSHQITPLNDSHFSKSLLQDLGLSSNSFIVIHKK